MLDFCPLLRIRPCGVGARILTIAISNWLSACARLAGFCASRGWVGALARSRRHLAVAVLALILAGVGAGQAWAESASCAAVNTDWGHGPITGTSATYIEVRTNYGEGTPYGPFEAGETLTYSAESVGSALIDGAGFYIYNNVDYSRYSDEKNDNGRLIDTNGSYTFVSNDGVDMGVAIFGSIDPTASVKVTASCAPAPAASTVTSVTVPSDGTYGVGETLSFTVNFDQSVTVTGTPTIALTVGTTSRIASYASGSGSASLVFRYIVQAGDIDSDGVALGMLSGGTILNSGGLNSVLTLNGVGSTLDILVDASTVPSAPDNVSATASDGAVVIYVHASR